MKIKITLTKKEITTAVENYLQKTIKMPVEMVIKKLQIWTDTADLEYATTDHKENEEK